MNQMEKRKNKIAMRRHQNTVFECDRRTAVRCRGRGSWGRHWVLRSFSGVFWEIVISTTGMLSLDKELFVTVPTVTQNQSTVLLQADGAGVLNCSTASSGPSFQGRNLSARGSFTVLLILIEPGWCQAEQRG